MIYCSLKFFLTLKLYIMKELFENRIKGLVYFAISYFLIRVALASQSAAIYGADTLAIMVGVVALIWVLFPTINDEINLALRLAFLSLSVYALIFWVHYDGFLNLSTHHWSELDTAFIVVFILLFSSLMTAVVDTVSLLKQSSDAMVAALIWLVAISGLIAVIDIILAPLVVGMI